jgi:hypothetical protein
MDELVQHEMQLGETYSTGAEEWYCPTCGRRILLNLPPANDLLILEPGDQHAGHSGSRGGLRIGPVRETHREDDDVSDESLVPWIRALEDLDINL